MSAPAFWQRRGAIGALLLPLGGLFWFVAGLRRTAYRRGWRCSRRVGVPVVVVGNLGAGGAGKTPLVLRLVADLRAAGRHPGVISHGYGGRLRGTQMVVADSDPAVVGDEPLLIAQAAACPVTVGRDRVAAARLLRERHPEVDVIVSDDGLQHYRLARDVEIVVVNGEMGFGNGWPLPAGPLREPLARLKQADAVAVVRRAGVPPLRVDHARVFEITPRAGQFYALTDPHTLVAAAALPREILAVAGIARPQQFFRTLAELGFTVRERAFPDHHAFRPADLESGLPVVMTEKDAVKCRAYARPDWYALEWRIEENKALHAWLVRELDALAARKGGNRGNGGTAAL